MTMTMRTTIVDAGVVANSSPAAVTEVASCAFKLDKDLLCPICMQIINVAFLTPCGHSFCYLCIVTHLTNKIDCPGCGHFLPQQPDFP